MQRSSSLLIIVSLGFMSAAAEGAPRGQRPQMRARRAAHSPPTRADVMRSVQSARSEREARQKILFRTGIMKRQMDEGRSPHAELVVDSPLAEVRQVGSRRGEHASYRVSYLRGGVLHGYFLVPQPGGDVAVERVALRLRPGTTVVEMAGGDRIDVHWDGTSRVD
jgi:hypothetical protein